MFLGEQTGKTSGALYLNIARRDPAVLESLGCHDATGFSAIAAFLHGQLYASLLCRGWQTLDLGGSETPSLDRFKQTIGAQPLVTTWVAMTRSEVT